MFTKRHEHELAEIKALTYELGQDFKEVLTRLERIEAAQGLPAGGNQGDVKAKRKADRARANRGEGSAPEPEPANPKRARRRSSAVAVGARGKPGKARRATVGDSSESAPSDGRTRKRRDGATRKPAKGEPASSPSADEE